MLGFPIVLNTRENPEECNSNKCDLSVLFYYEISCVKCCVVFLKRLQNVLNSNINEEYALPVDRKDIKVCFGDTK